MKKEMKGESWRKGYQQGIKEENKAWLEGKRCHSCGKEKEPVGLSDTCGDCFENL